MNPDECFVKFILLATSCVIDGLRRTGFKQRIRNSHGFEPSTSRLLYIVTISARLQIQ